MKNFYVGIDAGGTNIKAGLVSKQGQMIRFVSCPSQVSKGKAQIRKNVLGLLEELLDGDFKCQGICLAWPGPANMPLTLSEIRRAILKKYKLPIFSENDANLFALTEAVLGQGKKYQNVVGITLGTGMGCGVIEDKKIFSGAGRASEFGHAVINFNGPTCACGNRGCLETYVGSRGLKRLAKKYKLKTSKGEDLYALAQVGNKQALKLWQEFGDYLGIGLISLIKAYDPNVIVVGGQIAKARKFFEKNMKAKVRYKSMFGVPPIKFSKFKNATVLAAALVYYKDKKRSR